MSDFLRETLVEVLRQSPLPAKYLIIEAQEILEKELQKELRRMLDDGTATLGTKMAITLAEREP